MPDANQLTSINLGRIVTPPNVVVADPSPTYFPPKLYILNAGATGLAANAADRASQVALMRDNQSNTGSPNPTSPVGSAGSAGLPGALDASRLSILKPRYAVTGPNGANTAPIAAQRTPRWVKPALYVAGGLVLGWLIFGGGAASVGGAA